MTFPSAWVASLPEPLVIIDPARKCCYVADCRHAYRCSLTQFSLARDGTLVSIACFKSPLGIAGLQGINGRRRRRQSSRPWPRTSRWAQISTGSSGGRRS